MCWTEIDTSIDDQGQRVRIECTKAAPLIASQELALYLACPRKRVAVTVNEPYRS